MATLPSPNEVRKIINNKLKLNIVFENNKIDVNPINFQMRIFGFKLNYIVIL